MKKIIFAFLISMASLANAQIQDSLSPKKMYLKANAVFLPIGMLNAALEHQISKKWTIQEEIFISPWKSFAGKYAQVYMGSIEGRYYFNEAFKHWYIGANLHVAFFNMQKYNYWGNGYTRLNEQSPVYKLSDLYQKGLSIMVGATIGYQWQINDKWNLDLYFGGGHSEGFYRGYVKGTGERYEHDERGFNRSGEWVPYKGGLMVSYRLK